MMNPSHRLTPFLLWVCVLSAGLSGCAGNVGRESTGEYIDDAVLTAKVKTRLVAAPETSAAAINVETFKGVVQLSGFVATFTEAEKAAEIAATVPGVRRVENKLTVTVSIAEAQ